MQLVSVIEACAHIPAVAVAVAEPPAVVFALTRVLFPSVPEVYTVQQDD